MSVPSEEDPCTQSGNKSNLSALVVLSLTTILINLETAVQHISGYLHGGECQIMPFNI